MERTVITIIIAVGGIALAPNIFTWPPLAVVGAAIGLALLAMWTGGRVAKKGG